MRQVTVGDIGVALGIEYPIASALVKVACLLGVAKEIGKRPTANGKGKPATIFEMPDTLVVDFDRKVPAPVAVTPVVEVPPPVTTIDETLVTVSTNEVEELDKLIAQAS